MHRRAERPVEPIRIAGAALTRQRSPAAQAAAVGYAPTWTFRQKRRKEKGSEREGSLVAKNKNTFPFFFRCRCTAAMSMCWELLRWLQGLLSWGNGPQNKYIQFSNRRFVLLSSLRNCGVVTLLLAYFSPLSPFPDETTTRMFSEP
jgi:hypothetical protein